MGIRNNEQGLSLVGILMIVCVLAGLGVGGFFAFRYYQENYTGPSKASLPHDNMDAALIGFTFNMLPSLFTKLALINKEISLINSELARLDALESNYPQQKSLINPERMVWEKTKKSLLTVLQSFEKNIEIIYVAYKVNADKGMALMEMKIPELETSADEVINASQAETSRIKIDPPQTFLEKLETKFLKFLK
jgi:hypothetical protein